MPFPSAYRWRDLRRPAALDREPARRLAAAIVGGATVATVDRDAVEVAIERALVDAYGLWASGWRWASSEPGCGGPIAAWCCAEHSILPEEEPDPDAAATIERVVAALGEWWQLLGELEARFAALAAETAGAALDQQVERAAAALLPLAVERTEVEDAWYGTFAAFLRWCLEAAGHEPDRIRAIVDATVEGRFESWCAPDEPTARAACEALGRAVAGAPAAAPIDGLAAWLAHRDRKLQPAPIGSPRVAVAADGHRRFIDVHDRARDPARAARFAEALDACRASATRREPLTLDALAGWQAIVLGAPAGFRTTDAFAKGGRERYPIAADTAARFEAALADAADRRVPTAIRAARVYLDVCFFHPFADGNARAARLALDHVVTSSGLALHVAAPLFLLPRDPADPRGLWWFTYVIDRVIGSRATAGSASSAPPPP